jgi:hypothetical protein
MTIFTRERLVPTELIRNLATMTPALPFHIEVLGFIVHAIRFAVFPLVFFVVGRATGLILVSIFLFACLFGCDGMVAVLFVFGHCGAEGTVGVASGDGGG